MPALWRVVLRVAVRSLDSPMTDLDKLMRCSAWLMERYDLKSFPELVLVKVPVRHRCDDGRDYNLKGLIEGNKITILDDEDAVLSLIHETLHYVSYLKDRGASEAEVDARAREDLREFQRYEGLRGIVKTLTRFQTSYSHTRTPRDV